MKSQKGNVIFVMLTPARDCRGTPLFYTHHLQLHAGKRLGGGGVERGGWEWQLSEEKMCSEVASVDVVGWVTLAAQHAGDLIWDSF